MVLVALRAGARRLAWALPLCVLVAVAGVVMVAIARRRVALQSRAALYQEEDDGEWNLQRFSKSDFPGTNPDNVDGPSWIIGLHRDGEDTPGSWARRKQVTILLFILAVLSSTDIWSPVFLHSRSYTMGNSWL